MKRAELKIGQAVRLARAIDDAEQFFAENGFMPPAKGALGRIEAIEEEEVTPCFIIVKFGSLCSFGLEPSELELVK